jgi:hypothetical protein
VAHIHWYRPRTADPYVEIVFGAPRKDWYQSKIWSSVASTRRVGAMARATCRSCSVWQLTVLGRHGRRREA